MVQQIFDIYSSFFEKYPWVMSVLGISFSLFVFTRLIRIVFEFDSHFDLFGFCDLFRSLWVKVKNFIMPYVLAFWNWLHVQDGKENSGE